MPIPPAVMQDIAERHAIPSYFIWSFDYFQAAIEFRGKRVLEVGGSALPREFIEALGVIEWASVDILGHSAGGYQQERFAEHYRSIPVAPLGQIHKFLGRELYYICDGDAVWIPSSVADHFDVVVSVNAFEHVLDFPGLLATLKRVMRPGADLLSSFGPIWTCAHGSHFWVSADWNFDKPGPLPGHSHLLMSASMAYTSLLEAKVDKAAAAMAVAQIYTESRVNRLGFSDYLRFLQSAAFELRYFKPHYRIEVPSDRLEELRVRYPHQEDFQTYSAVLHAVNV
jgi:SAM-dependent methyltransferase